MAPAWQPCGFMQDGYRRWFPRWLPGKPSLWRLAAAVVVLYGSLCALAFLAGDLLLFRPHAAGYGDSPAIVKLLSADGAHVSARFEEAFGAAGRAPGPPFTVLFSHGNAEDLDDLPVLTDRLRALGLDVLAYDYQGYGTSEGAPNERHLYEDIDAAYDYLVGVRAVPPARILLYGRSIGGGPSVDLASRRPVAGVILESTFTSAFRVATRVRLLPWDELESLAKMPRLRCPVLVMHGTDDPLIPVSQGHALFDAAPGEKRALWVRGARHADLPFVAGDRYEAAILDFVGMIRARAGG